jgi:putative transposase
MKQKRAYQYRCYPTDEQEHILARTFGCVRFVYNWALRKKTDAYYQQGKRLYYAQLSSALTELKRREDTAFLNDVASVPLQQVLRHLDRAFLNFFEGRAKYPAFKKKHGPQSATYVGTAFKRDGTSLTLAKMDAPLDIRWSRPLPDGCTPTTVTITKDCAGRYFVSFLVEEEIVPLPVTPKMVGLDLGLKSMVITSDGSAFGNPRFFAKDAKKLARAQRWQARKRKGSKNRDKARRKVARIHARIAQRRRDYQHKLSTKIIRENQVVCVESLMVKNMVQNHCLARSISDVGWGEFVRQLEYKAQWYGRTLVKIDKWYPSSKRCFDCGHILETLSLDVRVWTCPECRTVHDRDINAARNILAAGRAVNACGESVRPGRAHAQAGDSRRSRKAS